MRVVLLLICLLAGLAAWPAMAAPYQLQPGDRLEIWVAQEGPLNREVTLAPDGQLSLPLIGHIAAQGMTIEELEAALMERLQPFYTESLNLAVVLLPNPSHEPSFYITGEVATPGVYPFRPGITVLHAVSIAGGPFRATMELADQDRSIELRNAVAQGKQRLADLAVTAARVRTELAGGTTVELPPEVAASDVAPTVAREQAILDLRLAQVKSQEESRVGILAAMESSTEAVRTQLTSINERIRIAEERLQATIALVEKGIVQVSQRQAAESALADMEGTRGELYNALAEQQRAVLEEANRVDTFNQERRLALVTELGRLEQELEDERANLVNNERALSLYTEGASAAPSTVGYTILRTQDGAVEELPAAESMLLEPGDLLRVDRIEVSVAAAGEATS